MIRKNSSKRLGSKGFSHVELTLLIVVIAVIAGVGFFVYSKNNNKSKADSAIPSSPTITTDAQDQAYASLQTVLPGNESVNINKIGSIDQIMGEPNTSDKAALKPTDESLKDVTGFNSSANTNSGRLARASSVVRNPYGPVAYTSAISVCVETRWFGTNGDVWIGEWVSFKRNASLPNPNNPGYIFGIQRRGQSKIELNKITDRGVNRRNEIYYSTDVWHESKNDKNPIIVYLIRIKNLKGDYRDPNNWQIISKDRYNSPNKLSKINKC